jgi:hypothetical protein
MSRPTRRDLIHFLEDIADRMKNRMLSDQEEKLVSQFYIDHSYYTCNTSNTSNNSNNNSLDSEKDLRKYITMGWYIYQQLNQS